MGSQQRPTEGSELTSSCPGASGLLNCEFIIHEVREDFMEVVVRTEHGFRRLVETALAEGKRKDIMTQEESEQFAWGVTWGILLGDSLFGF